MVKFRNSQPRVTITYYRWSISDSSLLFAAVVSSTAVDRLTDRPTDQKLNEDSVTGKFKSSVLVVIIQQHKSQCVPRLSFAPDQCLKKGTGGFFFQSFYFHYSFRQHLDLVAAIAAPRTCVVSSVVVHFIYQNKSKEDIYHRSINTNYLQLCSFTEPIPRIGCLLHDSPTTSDYNSHG